MLLSTSQTQRDKYWTSPLAGGRIVERIETERLGVIGEAGVGTFCLMPTKFQFEKIESSGSGWRCWLHNNVNVLNVTELCT